MTKKELSKEEKKIYKLNIKVHTLEITVQRLKQREGMLENQNKQQRKAHGVTVTQLAELDRVLNSLLNKLTESKSAPLKRGDSAFYIGYPQQ